MINDAWSRICFQEAINFEERKKNDQKWPFRTNEIIMGTDTREQSHIAKEASQER